MKPKSDHETCLLIGDQDEKKPKPASPPPQVTAVMRFDKLHTQDAFSTRSQIWNAIIKVCKTIMYLVFTHDTVLLNVDTMYKSMCGLDAMKCRGKQHILQKDVYICKQILR